MHDLETDTGHEELSKALRSKALSSSTSSASLPGLSCMVEDLPLIISVSVSVGINYAVPPLPHRTVIRRKRKEEYNLTKLCVTEICHSVVEKLRSSLCPGIHICKCSATGSVSYKHKVKSESYSNCKKQRRHPVLAGELIIPSSTEALKSQPLASDTQDTETEPITKQQHSHHVSRALCFSAKGSHMCHGPQRSSKHFLQR